MCRNRDKYEEQEQSNKEQKNELQQTLVIIKNETIKYNKELIDMESDIKILQQT